MKGPHGNINVLHREEQVIAATLWNGSMYFAEATHADQRVYEMVGAHASLWEIRLSDGAVMDLNVTFGAPSQVFMDHGMAAWSSTPWSKERRHFLYDLTVREFVWSNVSARDLGFSIENVEFLGLVGGHAEFAHTNGVYWYRNLTTNQTIELKVDDKTTPVGIHGSSVYWSRAPDQWFVSEGTGALKEVPPVPFSPASPFQMTQGRMLVVDYWNPDWGPQPGPSDTSPLNAAPSASAIEIPSVGVVATTFMVMLAIAAFCRKP